MVGGGTLQEVILANVSNSIDRKLRVALMEFGTPKNYIDFLTTRWNIGNFLNFGPGGAGCGFNHPDSNRLELKPLLQKSFFLSNIIQLNHCCLIQDQVIKPGGEKQRQEPV